MNMNIFIEHQTKYLHVQRIAISVKTDLPIGPCKKTKTKAKQL